MKHPRKLTGLCLFGLILAAAVSFLITLCMGAVRIPVLDTFHVLTEKLLGFSYGSREISKSTVQIIWGLRMPRVILGFAVGCGLALCGAVMQAIVQNPMADPYILGISSGATLGATASIFLGAGVVSGLWAFAGAGAACAAVIFLSSYGGKSTSIKMILSGMIVNALFTAFSNFIISVAGDGDGMMTIKFWTMGSMTRASWENIWPVILWVAAVTAFFLTQARPLNTLLLGEEAAITLGVNLSRLRIVYLATISLLTGILVSQCGTIGFMGLIIPHVARALVGTDHRRLLPVAALSGGIFLMWMDAFARSMISQTELPVGIFTALVGAPFFVYIMLKKRYGFGEA